MGNGSNVLRELIDCGLTRIAIAAVILYRVFVSKRLNRTCLFSPSCSRYGLDVLRRYGWSAGGKLAWRRIRRCSGDHSLRTDKGGLVELVTFDDRVFRNRRLSDYSKSRLSGFISVSSG
ncbi:membrane protein insertion efficiency factor YidD [Botrimarina colliarenosi]|uniref:membrane protein insertion efficiency factor YidD n=1 Tax=Botrimarina colliarenosi TaxID=2528001 RepID=UPI0011B3A5D5